MEISGTGDSRPGVKRSIWLGLCGFLMGAADLIPGVSGGTMAFILGIYEELLDAVHAAGGAAGKAITFRVKEALRLIPWKFLIPLGLGIATAVFSLSRGLSWLLHQYPVFVWAFFLGLIAASVLIVRKRIAVLKPTHLVLAAVFAVGAYFLVGAIPVNTPDAPWFFFLSGALAVCAMILPGISGAFILVLLGKYPAVLRAVVELDFFTLFLVISGAGVGLLSVARLLRWLFQRYRTYTIAAMMGLMIGSLRKFWPWKEHLEVSNAAQGNALGYVTEINILPEALTVEVALVLLLVLVGFLPVLLLETLAFRREVQGDLEIQES